MTDDGFFIEGDRHQLVMRRNWSRAAAWAAGTWAVIWCALVYFLTTLGGHSVSDAPWGLAVPAVAMAYVAWARACNRTVVTVTHASVTVRHGPLPWPGSRTVPVLGAKAIHTRVRIIHTRGADVQYCRIYLEYQNGRRKKLTAGLDMSALEMTRAAAQIATFLQLPVVND